MAKLVEVPKGTPLENIPPYSYTSFMATEGWTTRTTRRFEKTYKNYKPILTKKKPYKTVKTVYFIVPDDYQEEEPLLNWLGEVSP